MNDIVDLRVLFEHGVEGRLVGDVEVDELGPLTADELDAVEDLGGGVVQVVCNDHLVACLEERKRRKRADVACSSVQTLAVNIFGLERWTHPTTSTAGGPMVRLVKLAPAQIRE